MAISGKLVIFDPDGKPFDGPIPITDSEIENLFGCSVDAFQHMVFTDYKNMGLLQTLAQTRKHKPVVIEKPIDKLTTTLYKYLTTGTYLPKVELRWYRHEGNKKEHQEWFRITLEHVRVFSMKTTLPNIKDPAFERYSAIDAVQFVYQRITWLRTTGYMFYTDEWNGGFYDEFSEKDFNPKKEGEEGYIAERAPYVLEIAASGWDHQDDNRRKESPSEVREGDKILLQVEIDGNPRDGESARFEIYYQEPKGSALHFVSVPGKVKDSFAAAEWTVDFSSINKKKRKEDQVKEFKLHFEAVVQKKYGKPCPIGLCKPGVPVAFYEYPYAHESKLDSKGVPAKLLKDLCEYHETALLTPTRTGPVLVKEKWVYVFAKKGSGVSLFYECKPVVQGEKQTFEFVSWAEADREKNQKSYPRPTTGKSKDTFELQPDREYYVLISQIQLSLARIDYYTQHADTLAKRALHITANTLKSDSAPVSLYCTDYIEIAIYLREQYDKHVQSFEKFVTNYTKAQRRYLAGLVCAVANAKPKFKDWINYEAVTHERDEDNKENSERQTLLKTSKAHLQDWKLSEGFKIAFEDGRGTDTGEKAMLENASYLTSIDEVEYLTKACEDENNWLNRFFLNQDAFLVHRKLATLINEPDAQGILAQFLVGRYLAKYSPVKHKGQLSVGALVHMQESYIKEIQAVFDKADVNLFTKSLNKKNGNWFFVATDPDSKMSIITADFKEQGQINGRASLNKDVYNQARGKWNAAVGKVGPALQWAFAGIETVNMVNAGIVLFTKTETTENKIFNAVNVIGSFADLTSSLKFLGEEPLKEFYQKAGKTALIAEKSTEKVFARVNLAGSICDYIGAAKGLGEAAGKGYTGQAAGQAVIALASAATGVGAAATIMNAGAAIAAASGEAAAATTSATFLGLSAGPLGLIGLGLFIAGTGIVWYFSEEDLRKWAKRCLWAKSPDISYLVVHQTYDLHRILCDFEIDCYAISRQINATLGTPQPRDFENSFTIKIIPGYLKDDQSKYRVTLKITHEGGFIGKDTVVFNKTIEVTKKDMQPVYSAQGKQNVLLHRITLDEIGLPVTAINGSYTYKYEAQLDLEGNGVIMFPDEKKAKSGKLERYSNDLQLQKLS